MFKRSIFFILVLLNPLYKISLRSMVHIFNTKRTIIIKLLYRITNIKIHNKDNNNIFTTCIFRAKKKKKNK